MRLGRMSGVFLTSGGLYLILKRLARRAGLGERFNPHSFRHAFAREVLRLGADLATVAQYLGHTNVLVTAKHYARWAEDELRERHDKFSPIRHLKRGENGE
jgi:integrase/recombinase XerD